VASNVPSNVANFKHTSVFIVDVQARYYGRQGVSNVLVSLKYIAAKNVLALMEYILIVPCYCSSLLRSPYIDHGILVKHWLRLQDSL